MVRVILQTVRDGAARLTDSIGRFTTYTKRHLFQHYGFCSRPLEGAEAILIKKGNNIVIIASEDRRYRISLEEGEVALYNNDGTKVHLQNNNKILVEASAEIVLIANSVKLADSAGVKKLMTEDIISKFNSHTHLDPVSGYTGNPASGNPPVVYSAADATINTEAK